MARAPLPTPTSPLGMANLALRLLLELAALAALAAGPLLALDSLAAWALAIALPAVGAVAWGTLGVPGDGSRGKAPVAVPGPVRLTLEAALFSGACAALAWGGATALAAALAAATLVHYAAWPARVGWLVRGW